MITPIDPHTAEPGFYWVRDHHSPGWTVAYLREGEGFLLIGSDVYLTADEIAEDWHLVAKIELPTRALRRGRASPPYNSGLAEREETLHNRKLPFELVDVTFDLLDAAGAIECRMTLDRMSVRTVSEFVASGRVGKSAMAALHRWFMSTAPKRIRFGPYTPDGKFLDFEARPGTVFVNVAYVWTTVEMTIRPDNTPTLVPSPQ